MKVTIFSEQPLVLHFKFSAVYVLCHDCLSDHKHSWARMSSRVGLVVYGSDLNITGRTARVPVEEQG